MKKQTGFSVVEILIVVIILGVIGGLGWIIVNRHLVSTSSKVGNRTVEATVTPVTTTAAVKSALASKYVFYSGDDNDIPKGQVKVREAKSSAPYKVPGNVYYVRYNEASSLSVSGQMNLDYVVPSNEDRAIRVIIADELTKQGFTAAGPLNGDTQTGRDIYTKDGVICATSRLDLQSSGADVACGAKAEFIKEAARLKPIVAAIPDINQTTDVSLTALKDSPIHGYQTAELSIGDIGGAGYEAGLYKKDGQAWTFFHRTQNGFYCRDFTSQELKDAFRGYECYGNDGSKQTVDE